MTIHAERAESPAPVEVAFDAPWNDADPDFYMPRERTARVGWWRRLFSSRPR